MTTREEAITKAQERLSAVLGCTDTYIAASGGRLDIRFVLNKADHRFWLSRHAANGSEPSWTILQHRVNGQPRPHSLSIVESPNFETLISEALTSRPSPPDLVELRCPADSRRLFGKLIIPKPTPPGSHSLIEFSCPQCKRVSKTVTMHTFDAVTGELVTTTEIGPWTRRASGRWHNRNDDKAEPADELTFVQSD